MTAKDVYAANPESWQHVAFGVIELDDDDRVRGYNRAESALAQRSVEATLGRHFFQEVAPCTDVAEFRGRVAALADEGAECRFEYLFRFPWGDRRVRIRAMRVGASRYLFVTPIGER